MLCAGLVPLHVSLGKNLPCWPEKVQRHMEQTETNPQLEAEPRRAQPGSISLLRDALLEEGLGSVFSVSRAVHSNGHRTGI